MQYITLMLGDMPTNSYIVYDENTKNGAIFDPAANCDKILRILNKNEIKLKYIVLTHGHADHIGALNELKSSTNALVAINKYDLEFLTTASYNQSELIFGYDYTIDFVPEQLLSDGDKISFDSIEILCRHTPGHTPGSSIFLIEDIMISGDTIFKNGYGRTDLYGGSFDSIKRSIKMISGLNKNYKILPGHGYETTLFEEFNR